MNINFHYAAVKVLARHAGFSEGDSQTIAYASQFVDDATAHEEMALDKDHHFTNIAGVFARAVLHGEDFAPHAEAILDHARLVEEVERAAGR